ncbi:MAG: fatty acid desaturase [Emcibacter sp.]|nr:fatty acid desaturase [Emcibacter sp.]
MNISIEKNKGTSESLDDRLKKLASHCQKFKGAITRRSLFQLISTLCLFIASVTGMIATYENHYWISALLIIPTGGLVIRLFIFQHDCGHQSFFKTRKWNDRVGRFLSIFTFTPYGYWREAHNTHHANSGNLSKRGIGDIDTLTVREYLARTWSGKLAYRIYRHPILLLVIGGPVMILILQRFPIGQPSPFRKIWKSMMALNLAICIVYGTVIYFTGFEFILFAYLPVICVSAWIGGWLFFIQHQFENTVWDYKENWNFNKSAVLGSSYFVLPKVFQWFSGNIGLHHLHHMCGVIPNYRLQECHDTAPHMPEIREIRFWQSLKCIRLTLWDEDLSRLVDFSHLRTLKAA